MEHLAALDFQDFIIENAEAWVTILISPEIIPRERGKSLQRLYLSGRYQWVVNELRNNLENHLYDLLKAFGLDFFVLVITSSGVCVTAEDVKKTPLGTIFKSRSRQEILRRALQGTEDEALLNLTI